MTIESVAQMTHEEAVRATERIRLALDRVSTAWADLGERIMDAYQRRADLALGYSSWAAYAEAELKPSSGLAVEVRRQLVVMLSDAGMSTRAIAPTVGAPRETVRRDTKQQVTQNGSPAPITPDVSHGETPGPTVAPNDDVIVAESSYIDRATGEVLDDQHIGDAPAPEIHIIDDTRVAVQPTKRIAGLDHLDYSPEVTHEEIIAALDADPRIAESVEFARRYARRADVVPATAAYAHYRFAAIDRGEADAFWVAAAEKIGLREGDPVIALTNRFAEARRNREHLTKRIQLSLIFRAWNMRRTGKPMKFIRVNSPAGGLVPIPELR